MHGIIKKIFCYISKMEDTQVVVKWVKQVLTSVIIMTIVLIILIPIQLFISSMLMTTMIKGM